MLGLAVRYHPEGIELMSIMDRAWAGVRVTHTARGYSAMMGEGDSSGASLVSNWRLTTLENVVEAAWAAREDFARKGLGAGPNPLMDRGRFAPIIAHTADHEYVVVFLPTWALSPSAYA